MELLKKNIGLIAYGVVCLVLSVFLVIGIRGAVKSATECREKVEQQVKFFLSIQQNEYTLSRNNVRIAKENEAMVERKFQELRRDLADLYGITRDRPPTSVECVNLLGREIRAMHQDLETAKITVGQSVKYFTFDKVAVSSTLPPESLVPSVLRQLKIIREVVRLIAASQVQDVSEIARLTGFEDIEEDLYTITPLRVTVYGSLEQVQSFVNLLHKKSRYLFFVRNMSLQSQDQAPGGALAARTNASAGAPAATDRSNRRAGSMLPGMFDEPPGAMPGMFPRGPGQNPRDPLARRLPAGGADAMEAETMRSRITRNDLVAFQDRRFTANLRVDLVEFREPKEEN